MVTAVAPTSAAEAAEVLRTAGADGLTVLPRGASTKAHWGGTPSNVDILLDTRRLHGVTAHEPGDLVATVRAGTPLRDVQAVLGLAGQRLSLETGFAEATVGGVLATGEAGPLRLRHGSGRDLLIGVEFVRADGIVAHSGGRVVKNVAGYDMGRLLCGSYGTLGVITSATFRLHPLPPARTWVSCPVESAAELADIAAEVMSAQVSPSSVEVDLRGTSGTLAALIEGSRAGVDARAETAARQLGGAAVIGDQPAWWGSYPFAPDDVAVKLAAPVGRLSVLGELSDAAGPDVAVRGSAGTGVVYAALPGSTSAEHLNSTLSALRAALTEAGGSCVVLAAPPRIRDEIDLWGPVPGLALMRRIKDQFDPARRLASGRFVGGI